jgi:hypothetical protein
MAAWISPKPSGRQTIAQRFIAGFPGVWGTSPGRDGRDLGFTDRKGLSPLAGLFPMSDFRSHR